MTPINSFIVKIRLISLLLLIGWNSIGLAASMFWSAKNGKSEVFLLGSVHVATPSYYPLPNKIESSFSRADVLVLEVNLLSMESQQQMNQLQQLSMYGAGDSLDKHIDKHTYRLLQDYLQQAHLPLQPMLQFKPAILAMTLSMAKLATLGYTPSNGIDMYFLQKANDKKMPVDELENARMQMELLLNIPNGDKFLRYTLEQMDKVEEVMKKVDRAWKTGDGDYLKQLLIDDTETKYPELKQTNETFLYQRNIGMAKKIEAYLNSGKTYFVIVGSGHLVGSKGIVALLKNKGYQVVQH